MIAGLVKMQFPSCQTPEQPLGLYPLVSRAEDAALLFQNGITTLQIRIKDLQGEALRQELAATVRLAKTHKARLFINDYWQIAIELGAYGVHLGQEDLHTADTQALFQAGLRLGVSTHNPSEIETALPLQPSYLAIGPIFGTQSKQLDYPAVGLDNLSHWSRSLPMPVVAIGGIGLEQLGAVVRAGANGVAMIQGLQLHQADGAEHLHTLQTRFAENYQAWSKTPNDE
jgi:thiamine-phosphate pyrophosphorylase/hydroxymethylpyrimidine kinase/phosphomethylpyrimidine kinase/thiamine-phosphate diphosphorylase